MSDNVAITAGTGTSVATDDVGGVQYQRIKLALGADGTAADAGVGHGVASGALRVELPTDGTGVIATVGAVTAITNALPAGTNAIGKLSANGGVTIGDVNVISSIPGTGATNLGKAEDAAHTSGDTGVMALGVRKDTATALAGTDGDYQPPIFDANGKLWVNAAITSGSAVAGTAGTPGSDVLSIQGIASMTPLQVGPSTAGGLSLNSLIAPATPAKNGVKTSAGHLYTIHAFNLLATPVYLKIWNNVSGSVTLGTTACDYQYMIPGNTAGAGFVAEFPHGVAFSTGILTAVTLSISTTDNTSITANSVIVNIGYK